MTSSNSSRSSRISPSMSTPGNHGSKLPKIFQKQGRDRSKSVSEHLSGAGMDSSGMASSSSSIVTSMEGSSSKHRQESKKLSRLRGSKDAKDDRHGDRDAAEEGDGEETPVIIEPSLPPARPRTRSERPLSASSSEGYPTVSYYPASNPTQRLTDMGTRLSGWFSHTFSSSTTDLSLPTILSNTSTLSTSPKKVGGLSLLTAARTGKGHLDKAVRYILDSDATPDKCTDPIWLLGVQHPGYEHPPPPPASSSNSGRRSSLDFRKSSSSNRSSIVSRGATSSPEPSLVQSGKNAGLSAHWPPIFYSDFTSRIWLTYRSHFPPIRHASLAALEAEVANQSVAYSPATPSPRRFWGGEKGWTSDSGWGCMLRTGQSLLANALIHYHLGRDWRRPPRPVDSADYATYVKILTWFFDSPDPLCPFSVHRMALAGKELGTEVGCWFGPSTAAGAIKTLVHAFPDAGLGVSVAADGVVYETDVLAASNASPYSYRHSRISTASPRRSRHHQTFSVWGQRPVLVLIGIRLGVNGVNPIYYEAVKDLYTFPQSVGIAGGRPSSSYYFVGAQADNLFYLDPHHTRPAVPLRPSPTAPVYNGNNSGDNSGSAPSSLSDRNSHHVTVVAPTPILKQTSSQSSYTSRMSPSPSFSPDSSSGFSIPHTGMGQLDTLQFHLCNAYTQAELQTFHCDRVRKMPMSGLDPSMLLGFLCRDERDWRDFRERVAALPRKAVIFSIQDEPPSWPSDSDDMGLESMSDVEVDLEDEQGDKFSDSSEHDARKGSVEGRTDEGNEANHTKGHERKDSAFDSEPGRRSHSEEGETEDDAIAPLTPGPGTSAQPEVFAIAQERSIDIKHDSGPFSPVTIESDEDTLDDEGWVDSVPSALRTPQQESMAHMMNSSHGSISSSSSKSRNGSTRSKPSRSSTVPVPSPHMRDSTQPVTFVPFPVVDDREDIDDSYIDAGDEAETPHMSTSRSRPSSQVLVHGHQRQRTESARMVYSSVNSNGRLDTGGSGSRTSALRNQGHGVRARDGGRTQSGGVRGVSIVPISRNDSGSASDA